MRFPISLFLLLDLLLLTACRSSFHVRPANFSAAYINAHRGRCFVEVPQVQELVHIAMALTPTGLRDSNLVDHETKYYQEVRQYFGKHTGDPLIKSLDDLLQNGKYARVKMNSCGYYWRAGSLQKDSTYEVIGWEATDYVKPLLKELEHFATLSHFQDFYDSHRPFYDSLIAEQNQQVPIMNQWRWLEKQFPTKYDSYRITFSPLVNGSHSTARFEGNGFKQTIMFICAPFQNKKFNTAVNTGLLTRIVFTEIDHNYVNPLTINYSTIVDKEFSNRKKWTNGKDSDSYNSAYAVFNEYMTWGVFTLFCYENYNPQDFTTINTLSEKQLSDQRGFYRFRQFNQQLLASYKSRKPGETVADLYPKMLTWCQSLH